jgi:hypothetical protein
MYRILSTSVSINNNVIEAFEAGRHRGVSLPVHGGYIDDIDIGLSSLEHSCRRDLYLYLYVSVNVYACRSTAGWSSREVQSVEAAAGITMTSVANSSSGRNRSDL